MIAATWTGEQVRQWVRAAWADGWEVQPTYAAESADRAATGRRDGWVAMTYLRPGQQPTLDVWGPDELQIEVPPEYDWAVLQHRLQRCLYCGRDGQVVVRVGFAGRSCPKCLPAQQTAQEFAGWAD